MHALTVLPGRPSSARLEQIPEPRRTDSQLLVETIAVGVCGTDREILRGEYGEAPPGRERLVLGHESLGRVLEAAPDSGFARGDLVAGIVRSPDPVPCASCAIGEWDMCKNGLYTEHGIKGADGFLAERFVLDPDFAVRVDPKLGLRGVLVEPASVVAKAWEHVEAIGRRARWEPRRALVTGAGPIGLLAALMAAQRGLEVHVLDRADGGPKPELVRALGATYHTGSPEDACASADVVVECTGAAPIVLGAIRAAGPGGVVCLAGISSGARAIQVDVAGINRELVLENAVVFGSVNANRRHYDLAVDALRASDPAWLEGLVTRRVPLAGWQAAFDRERHDVKVVVEVRA
jgi:threonine dehydrogenase-like Zn-dependent dehydrogenase